MRRARPVPLFDDAKPGFVIGNDTVSRLPLSQRLQHAFGSAPVADAAGAAGHPSTAADLFASFSSCAFRARPPTHITPTWASGWSKRRRRMCGTAAFCMPCSQSRRGRHCTIIRSSDPVGRALPSSPDQLCAGLVVGILLSHVGGRRVRSIAGIARIEAMGGRDQTQSVAESGARLPYRVR